MSYVIAWRSKLTDRYGEGSTLFSRERAFLLCIKLDQKHPYMEHWPKYVDCVDSDKKNKIN